MFASYGFRLKAITALLIVAGLIGAFPVGAEDNRATLDSIVKAWRNRESASRSFQFELADEYITGKGSLMGEPQTDVTSSESRRILVDGDNMRYERVGLTLAEKRLIPVKYVSTHKLMTNKSLYERDKNEDETHSRAYIRTSNKHSDSNNLYISPISRHYRALTVGAISPAKLRIVTEDASIEGVRCILLESPGPGARRDRFWVAPDQDMAILRYVRYITEDVLEYQLEASFKRGPVHGWVPDRWRAVRFGDDKKRVLDSCSTRVIAFGINISVEESSFDIVFPPGTEVFDKRSNTSEIVKLDGSSRKVLGVERERGAKYSELIETDTGRAGLKSGLTFSSWRLVAVIAAALTVIGTGLFLTLRARFPRT